MTDTTTSEVQPDDSSVKVAVRVRPQLAKERIDMCQVCTTVPATEPQIFLGKDKAFTFDNVFDMESQQDAIYEHTASELIEGTFEGYNATIFAYGQTGSGKTYTMGTGFAVEDGYSGEGRGIIPRAVHHLFAGIEARRRQAAILGHPLPDFKVNANFMELYNEEVLDLFDTTRDPSERGRKSHIKIHEDACGGIYCVGVTTRQVGSLEETMACLKQGALSRTTAATNMNAQSSRSHAIFTLHIKQHRMIPPSQDGEEEDKEVDTTEVTNEFETLTAKFHFVDLAGSERLKRTGATGDRAKEGISINCGLLALGNVISALGDKAKKGSHVPYRDSKLTRLLQDSLGGNSRTMMIACISPSDRDFMETLNTLKYANRAKNIKNRVTVNQDKTSRQMAALRAEIRLLQEELNDYKTGKRLLDADGVETVNDMFHENSLLQSENSTLRQRIKALSATLDQLRARHAALLAQHAAADLPEGADGDVQTLITGYISEMEDLRCKLIESEALCEALQRRGGGGASRAALSPSTPAPPLAADVGDNQLEHLLEEARRDVVSSRRAVRRRSRSRSSDPGGGEEAAEDEDEDEENGEDKHGPEGAPGKEQDEDEDVDDEEVDEESDSDMDDASAEAHLHEDLADLQCEISIKQKLIDELEMSQKRLHHMRAQYEEKLLALSERIRQTELERDKVLLNLGSRSSSETDQVKKEKAKFERRLCEMNGELKKLQAAKKEHGKLLRNKSHYEKQLGGMQKDLADLKRLKVRLMSQIKAEAAKSRQSELRRTREVAQLKKEQRAKENKIRSLQTEKRHRDIVLKRKQEEVEVLRKRQQSGLSARAAGRVGKQTPSRFSARQAKTRWDVLARTMDGIIVKKQTMTHMERDMERWLKQRDSLRRKVERLERRRAGQIEGSPFHTELGEQLDTLRANIAFVQEQINECQSNIMSMEEAKADDAEPGAVLSQCASLDEAKYLLDHFLNLVIQKGLAASQKEWDNKELVAKLHQERMDTTFQRDMLQYLIEDKVEIDFDGGALLAAADDSDDSSDAESSDDDDPQSSERSSSPAAAAAAAALDR